jgi:hypothetical protein
MVNVTVRKVALWLLSVLFITQALAIESSADGNSFQPAIHHDGQHYWWNGERYTHSFTTHGAVILHNPSDDRAVIVEKTADGYRTKVDQVETGKNLLRGKDKFRHLLKTQTKGRATTHRSIEVAHVTPFASDKGHDTQAYASSSSKGKMHRD